MDANALILQAAVDENAALKAEVARLKLQNESLEIRLATVHDKVASLQQFIEGAMFARREAEAALERQTSVLDFTAQLLEEQTAGAKLWREQAQRLRQELIHRGADDPMSRKPQCENTVFAALQLVSKWDRDESFTDLKKQRLESLRRIDVLKTGKELMMDDVVNEMNKDGCRMMPEFKANLHYVLRELREQLREIYEAIPHESAHDEWFKYPLSMFTLDYVEGSDMDESSDMDDQ